MGNMKDIGLLDCEDRPSIEENFKRVQGGGGGKIKPEQLPDGYPYETEGLVEIIPEMEISLMADENGQIGQMVDIPNSVFEKLRGAMGEGKTGIVVGLDGDEYDCELRFGSGIECGVDIGTGAGADKYPFYVQILPDKLLIITSYAAERDVNFSLSLKDIVIVPMAEKFAPKGMVVTLTKDVSYSEFLPDHRDYTADKTYQEIIEALYAGKNVVVDAEYPAYLDGEGDYIDTPCLYSFNGVTNGNIAFRREDADNNEVDHIFITEYSISGFKADGR